MGATAGLEPASPLPYSPIVEVGFCRKVEALSIELRREAMERQMQPLRLFGGAYCDVPLPF